MAMEEMSFRPMNSINMLDQQFSVDIRESSVNFLHSEELDSPTDELVVKVRKPYTITKQREKWTEEEHEKFLEAIKLYGRAWRRIKEHIGTKTAIQIRSHAQKFFSKVLNEPITAKAIEIPPPRPKRKPLHPYPRKMAQACPKRLSVVVQRDESSWVRIPSVPDQENESPVSVLSAVGSDFMLSPVSDPTSHRTLATSSTVRGDPDEPALDSGYCSPTVSSIEDDTTLSPEGAFNMSMKQNETRMELDLHSEDGILHEEVALLRQSASFKLFGNIVSVTDSSDCRNESSCFAGNPECLSSSSASNNESTPLDMQAQVCTHSSTEEPARVVSHPTAESRWVDGASPVYYFLVPNCESLVPIAPLPVWWSPYSDSTLGPCNTINMGLKKEHPDMARNSDDECSEKEDSSTGSNSNSSTQGSGNESPKCIAESAHTFKLNHSANSAFRPVRAISDSPAKVFFLP